MEARISLDQPSREDVTALTAEIDHLRAKLQDYKRLDEDLAAERVFEGAKKKITAWITFGGLFFTLLGLFGVREALKYGEGLVDEQMKKISADRIDRILKEKSQQVVADEVKKQEPQIEAILRNQSHAMIADEVQKQSSQFEAIVKDQSQEIIVAEVQKQEPRWDDDARRIIQLSLNPIGAQIPKDHAPLLQTSGRVDYTADMLPVRSEGRLIGSATFAPAYALEYQIKKHMNREVRISFQYIDCEANHQDGGKTCTVDRGAVLSAAIRAIQNEGAVAETAWMPYKVPPSGGDEIEFPNLSSSEHFRIKTALQLSTVESMKSALKQYGPIVAGLTIYRSIFSGNTKGVVPMPGPTETDAGSISVCIVGFDDQTKQFKFEGAWGTEWGDKGYGYIPYDYMAKYSSDPWAISM